jgi:predicted RNase H-like nuclease
MPTALGIDVGVTKGLDLVLLGDDGRVRDTVRRATLDAVTRCLRTFEPDVVTIDSPPRWATSGARRAAERELSLLGIHSYGTPSDPAKQRSPFNDWMREGFRVFETVSAERFPLYTGGSPRHTSMEIYPHATAVALAGYLPPVGLTKARWRAAVLKEHGVDTRALHGADPIDAALAALTGLLALDGRRLPLGDPAEGVIVLPLSTLPNRPFQRAASDGKPKAASALPGFRECECGCGATVRRRFLPGHDARLRSRLLHELRAGRAARMELSRLGWVGEEAAAGGEP